MSSICSELQAQRAEFFTAEERRQEQYELELRTRQRSGGRSVSTSPHPTIEVVCPFGDFCTFSRLRL